MWLPSLAGALDLWCGFLLLHEHIPLVLDTRVNLLLGVVVLARVSLRWGRLSRLKLLCRTVPEVLLLLLLELTLTVDLRVTLVLNLEAILLSRLGETFLIFLIAPPRFICLPSRVLIARVRLLLPLLELRDTLPFLLPLTCHLADPVLIG